MVFTHGILEGPKQFIELSQLAYKRGHSVSALLLPGHGGSGVDFASSNSRKWMEYLEESLSQIKKQYNSIILVGHSMGALLSVLAYSKDSRKIDGIVALATPLNIRLKVSGMIRSIKIGMGSINNENALEVAAANAFSIEKSSILTYLSWAPRYIDLFYLVKDTRKKLSNIKVPLLIVHTKHDEFVSNKTLKLFNKRLNNTHKKIVTLNNSGHFYYDDNDLHVLKKEFELFLDSLSNA
ncbi:alpha/beta hydrolase [Romboutsia weinsteinii]|uniref:alpha/beta hydrolase n=1 Tax=Romboutsia weinsteinii TaxID=2020949 RepID=UPI00237BDC5B|nr:alpha/beta fold hydrolase [Romboutsia weinsteinii]